MKTAVGSGSGDDDEERQAPWPIPQTMRHLEMARLWLAEHPGDYGTPMFLDTNALWNSKSIELDATSMTPQELAVVLQGPGARRSCADSPLVLCAVGDPAQLAPYTTTSATSHRLVPRRSWSAKLGPVTVAMRLLSQRGRVRLPSLSLSWLTGAAVRLAGKKRSAVRAEWASHLCGCPDRRLSRQEQVRAACEFLLAAVRFRLQDAADLGWKPIDAVLGSRALSNIFVWLPVIVTLVAIVRHDGQFGLVADDQDPIALGIALYATIKAGRGYRKVRPPKYKPRRARE